MKNKIEDSFVGIENDIQLNDELLKRPKVENINITKKKEKTLKIGGSHVHHHKQQKITI